MEIEGTSKYNVKKVTKKIKKPELKTKNKIETEAKKRIRIKRKKDILQK